MNLTVVFHIYMPSDCVFPFFCDTGYLQCHMQLDDTNLQWQIDHCLIVSTERGQHYAPYSMDGTHPYRPQTMSATTNTKSSTNQIGQIHIGHRFQTVQKLTISVTHTTISANRPQMNRLNPYRPQFQIYIKKSSLVRFKVQLLS
jgi:hypothetical protein